MVFWLLATMVTAFMTGCAAAIFIILVIGIRNGDRTQRLLSAEHAPLDSFTRTLLGAGSWPGTLQPNTT